MTFDEFYENIKKMYNIKSVTLFVQKLDYIWPNLQPCACRDLL